MILAPSVGSHGGNMNGSTGRPGHALQQLPNEAVQLILERLNFRDLKALSLSCKIFAAWSKMATRIQASFHIPDTERGSIGELARFLEGAHCVTRLGIEMEAEDGVPYLEMQQSIQELACAVRHCAPSLRILRLRLFQTTSFRDYETDAFHPDGLHSLLVSICKCTHLRMLYINTGLISGLCTDTGDAVSMLCAKLPHLLVLQWRMAMCGPERPNHFSTAFVLNVASNPTLQGLQLLQVDNFTFQDHVALPASLRYVAIYNEAFELLRPIGALLKVCRNLEELYLTGYQCCDTQRPDMSTVWPTAQTLRILVLDVLQDIKTLAFPACAKDEQTLPNLQILAVRHLCTVGHLLNVRCPDLHTMVLFLASLEHTKFLELFLRQGHGKLASLQVLFYTGSRRKEQYSQFWSALRPAQSLQKLQLVISATQAEPVKEVAQLLDAAYDLGLQSLKHLSEIAIYIDSIFTESPPVHFLTGGDLRAKDAPGSAQQVVSALGKLVTAGVLPALRKVCLYPCWDVAAGCSRDGQLPSPAAVPYLECMALHSPGDRTGGEWGNGLRSMVGSDDAKAAMRAIESLSVSYDVEELM